MPGKTNPVQIQGDQGQGKKTKKSKRRNSEKRKEKSRDAARTRRGKEAEMFTSLAQALPITLSATQQLDKASIMRLTISHLKMRQLFGLEQAKQEVPSELEDYMNRSAALEALDGFVVIISLEGDMVYISEDINKYLGLTQVDMIGQSIYDYVHPCEEDEIKEVLSGKLEMEDQAGCSFFARMKCTLTLKGRNVNFKSATYKVIKFSGHKVEASAKNMQRIGLEGMPGPSFVMLVAEPVQHPANIDVPLDSSTFLSRHTMDMKYTYCDDSIENLLQLKSSDILGKCAYSFHHPLDNALVERAFKEVLTKGQSVTDRYRFLAKNGGYVWMVTQATVINNSRTDKPQCIVCVNYVISGIEDRHCQMADFQHPVLEESAAAEPLSACHCGPIYSTESILRPPDEAAAVSRQSVSPHTGPIYSTETIFTPFTKEMEEKFYMCPEIQTIVMDDGLEDLTHLAPMAGELMLPLGFKDDTLNGNLYDDLFPNGEVSESSPLCSPGSTYELSPMSTSSTPYGIMTSRPHSNTSMDVSPSGQISPVAMNLPEFNAQQTVAADMPASSTSKKAHRLDARDEMLYRAPYIPMDTGEDLDEFPLIFLNDNPIMGCTESVFSVIPEEHKKVPQYTPLSTLRHQSKQKHQKTATDLARTAATAKLKLPMETNRLETGPPVKRVNPESVTGVQHLKMLKLNESDRTPMARSDCSLSPVARSDRTLIPINIQGSMPLETANKTNNDCTIMTGQPGVPIHMAGKSNIQQVMRGGTNSMPQLINIIPAPTSREPSKLSVITGQCHQMSKPSQVAVPMEGQINTPAMMSTDRTMSSTMISRPKISAPMVPPQNNQIIQVSPLGSLTPPVQPQMSGQMTMPTVDIPSMLKAPVSPLHVETTESESVLRNLLLCGIDTNHGYKLKRKQLLCPPLEQQQATHQILQFDVDNNSIQMQGLPSLFTAAETADGGTRGLQQHVSLIAVPNDQTLII